MRIHPALSVCLAIALAGCSVVPPGSPPSSGPATASQTTASPSAAATPSPSPSTAAPTASETPGKPRTPDAPRDTPYTVNGVVLVNRLHPLASSYVPPWASEGPDGLEPVTRAAIEALIAAARKQGLTLRVRSGYRSWAAQEASYTNAVKQYGEKLANSYFAPPGSSEHQTGLAADLTNAAGDRGYAFRGTPEAAFIAQHATEFGLVVRYPENRQGITNVEWEPWHVRYVGPEVAAYFVTHPGLTLEEYLGEA